jgi:hypothetical protein
MLDRVRRVQLELQSRASGAPQVGRAYPRPLCIARQLDLICQPSRQLRLPATPAKSTRFPIGLWSLLVLLLTMCWSRYS